MTKKERNQYQKEYQSNYRKTYTDKRNRVYMTLNDSYYSKLEYIAEQDEIKPVVKARILLEKVLDNQNPNQSLALQEELRQTKLLIRNIATNVNQIAHRSNTLRAMVEEQDLLLHLKKLEDTINNYVSKKAK